MQVTIETKPPVSVDSGMLDIVRLVASSAGYIDVDVEPFPNSVTITAIGAGLPNAHASGKTEYAACLAFIHHLAGASNPESSLVEAAFDWILYRATRCTACDKLAFWRCSERAYPGAPRDVMQCDTHKTPSAQPIPDADVIRRIIAYKS